LETLLNLSSLWGLPSDLEQTEYPLLAVLHHYPVWT